MQRRKAAKTQGQKRIATRIINLGVFVPLRLCVDLRLCVEK